MEGHSEPGPSKLTSPVKKHVRGKGLTSGEKIQIVNVYKTLFPSDGTLPCCGGVACVFKRSGELCRRQHCC